MTEYFIRAGSFAAPFVSDESTGFVTAASPSAALERFAAEYTHPAGLYAADCYASADAYHKRQPRLARWLCNKAQAVENAVKDKGAASIYSASHDKLEIDGKDVPLKDARAGSVV